MSSRALVSVIIIFLNAEKFIEEAIESVFAQSYTHWRLLLVDDGSTDASSEIARRYVAHNPNQGQYLEHPGHQNRGMSASRNLGIRHASGAFVAFLDADDVWLPHKLEQQVAILTAQPEAAMVYGRTEYWYSWTGNPRDGLRDYVQDHGIEVNRLYAPPDLLPLYLCGKAAIPPPCSILVRREFIQGIGGFEEGFRELYEDQAFYAKLCLEAPVFTSAECWDRYRQHPGQSCVIAAKAGEKHFSRLLYLDWLTTYLLEQGFSYPEVWHAVNRELWLYRHYRHPARLPLSKHTRYLVRWTKKWLLRLEAQILPTLMRRWLWTREQGYVNYTPPEKL
jgi:glycosyltransferase involved in cell wall biosynthesis